MNHAVVVASNDGGQPIGNETRTGLVFVLDTNAVDDDSSAMVALRQRADDGQVELVRTDTMDTELQAAPDDKRPDLLERSGGYVEQSGVMVWGHSRWGHSVWAADDDTHLDDVFAALFPNKDRASPKRNDLRDAMHVSTAIRYGATGFITDDGDVLKRRDVIAETFGGFVIVTPADALALVDASRQPLSGD